MFRQLLFILRLTRSHKIARRYFVVNGFDGALTLLGLNVGFYLSDDTPLTVVISACLAAAVALGVSGVSSAYISEAAERERELRELEGAMVRDLSDSAHGRASRFVPWLIAIVNGMAPLLFGLIIITPLWLGESGVAMPLAPVEMALLVAMGVLFLLGLIIGRIRGSGLLWSGLRTLIIALLTVALIVLLEP